MTTTTAEAPWRTIARQVWADLQPFPGRFGLTWRVALLCALVAAVAMILKIPESAISCYLVIFLMKPDAVQNCIMGLGLILLATGVVALMIPIINMSIDSPAMRLLVMFVASYIFLFLSSTTPLGEQAAIVGLIIAFIMTLVTMVPVGQIGDQGLLMAWKMACMPMALMVLFNLVLGIPAQTHVRNTIAARLRAASEEIEIPGGSDEIDTLIGEGNDLPLQQMLLVMVLNLVPRTRSRWLNGAVESSYRILIAAQGLPAGTGAEDRAALARQLREAATEVEAGRIPAPAPAAAALQADAARALQDDPAAQTLQHDPAAQTLREALTGLAKPDGGGAPHPRMIPLLASDAFTNPDHQRYALKTSIAAVLCYLIYTGIQWDGIHTAMITCYVAALGTTGETLRKLSLRICGCLVGAAMGAFALIHVMPHLTSVGGLMGMIFVAVLVGAWVSSGPERISYAGVQIALAFLLTTLNGFGPSYEFSQASGRIYGILLGIFVIYVIFTQFWPRGVVKEVRIRLHEALDALDRLAGLPGADRRARTEDQAAAQIALAQAEDLLEAAPFEPRHQRPAQSDIRRLDELRETLRELAIQLFLDPDPAVQGAELHRLRAELESGATFDGVPAPPGLPAQAAPVGPTRGN